MLMTDVLTQYTHDNHPWQLSFVLFFPFVQISLALTCTEVAMGWTPDLQQDISLESKVGVSAQPSPAQPRLRSVPDSEPSWGREFAWIRFLCANFLAPITTH